ncbi:right-handed parallel beta-helix repeat-containing protein [Vibrio harveyi]|uniref:right-handed parallel beta-helix repeat-containing protein n=1 Tax=Vibrio harveyi TaxID=669 RepID=UPI0036F3C055
MAGVVVTGGSFVDLTGAKVKRNGGGGVVVEDSHVLADDAQIADNYGNGITVSGESSVVSAREATIENNGFEQAFDIIGVDKAVLDENQLELLVDKAIELNALNNRDDNTVIEELLNWANGTAIFATIAGSEPFIATVSAVVAFGVTSLKQLKATLKG